MKLLSLVFLQILFLVLPAKIQASSQIITQLNETYQNVNVKVNDNGSKWSQDSYFYNSSGAVLDVKLPSDVILSESKSESAENFPRPVQVPTEIESEEEVQNQVQTVPGFLFEQIERPILYDSLIPIIFKVRVPDSVLERGREHREGESGGNSNSSSFIQNLYDDDSDNELKIPRFPCNKLLPHFKNGYLTTPTEFEHYKSSLKKCSQKIMVVEDIPPFDFNTKENGEKEVTIATKIEQRHLWNEAIESCRSNFIPSSLINMENLYSAVIKADPKISEKNLRFAISISRPHRSAYFQHKIADCIFLTDQTFAIRLLVPTVKMESQLSLLKYFKIPFLKYQHVFENAQMQVCQLANFNDYYIEEYMENNQIKDGGNSAIFNTDCNENTELCQIPEVSERDKKWAPNSCLTAISKIQDGHNNSKTAVAEEYFQEVERECPLTCEQIDSSNLSPIQRTGSNVFSILGENFNSSATYPIKIQCTPSKELKILKALENSTMLVTLPCNCKIKYRTMTFWPKYPCDSYQFDKNNVTMATIENVGVSYVQPVHWRHLEDQIQIQIQNQNQSQGEDEADVKENEIEKIKTPANPAREKTIAAASLPAPSIVDIVYQKQRNYDRKLKELTQNVRRIQEDENIKAGNSNLNLIWELNADRFNCTHPDDQLTFNWRSDLETTVGQLVFCNFGFRTLLWSIFAMFMTIIIILVILSYCVCKLNRWRREEQILSFSSAWGKN